MAKGLTRKQELFVAEYLIDLNATRAASAAGYSKKGADVTGSKLLVNPKVSEQIAKKSEKRLEKLELTGERIIDELKKLAFYDPKDLFEDDGSVKLMRDIPEDCRKALVGFEVAEIFDGATGEQKHAIGLLKKVKQTERIRALELLGRWRELGLWKDSVEHSGKVDTNALTDEERAAKIAAILNAAKSRKNAK
jgi:phage terminase small subunit